MKSVTLGFVLLSACSVNSQIFIPANNQQPWLPAQYMPNNPYQQPGAHQFQQGAHYPYQKFFQQPPPPMAEMQHAEMAPIPQHQQPPVAAPIVAQQLPGPMPPSPCITVTTPPPVRTDECAVPMGQQQSLPEPPQMPMMGMSHVPEKPFVHPHVKVAHVQIRRQRPTGGQVAPVGVPPGQAEQMPMVMPGSPMPPSPPEVPPPGAAGTGGDNPSFHVKAATIAIKKSRVPPASAAARATAPPPAAQEQPIPQPEEVCPEDAPPLPVITTPPPPPTPQPIPEADACIQEPEPQMQVPTLAASSAGASALAAPPVISQPPVEPVPLVLATEAAQQPAPLPQPPPAPEPAMEIVNQATINPPVPPANKRLVHLELRRTRKGQQASGAAAETGMFREYAKENNPVIAMPPLLGDEPGDNKGSDPKVADLFKKLWNEESEMRKKQMLRWPHH